MMNESHGKSAECSAMRILPAHIGAPSLQNQIVPPSGFPAASYRILRKKEVCEITGLSSSSIYNKLAVNGRYADPSFPRQVRLGRGAVGWHSIEIFKWVAERQKVD